VTGHHEENVTEDTGLVFLLAGFGLCVLPVVRTWWTARPIEQAEATGYFTDSEAV